MSDVAEFRREAFRRWIEGNGGVQAVAAHADVAPTTIYSYLGGKGKSLTDRTAAKISAAFGITIDEMLGGGLVRILGAVGASPDGDFIQSMADPSIDLAPIPPGGTSASVAVVVKGRSMHGIADDGALVYFEIQQLPPSDDMIGESAVVQTEDGRVLFKRLQRGKDAGCYDLESIDGDTLKNVRLAWAAEPTAIIPPRQARRIIRRGGV